MSNIVHWIGVAVTVALGAVLAWFHLLPVEHAVIFVGSLFWLWQGLSVLCGFYRNVHYPRKIQNIWGGIQLVLGAVWLAMSMWDSPMVSLLVMLLTFPAIPAFFYLQKHFRT